MSNKSFAIYILAGGKSTRMGTDKALLMLGKKPILQYILDETKRITNKVFLITNNTSYKSFGVEIVPDIMKEIGPAGGIDAMLHHTNEEYNVILSCDMPFVNAEAIQLLLNNAEGFQITYSIFNNYPEMMFSVVHQSCKSIWRDLILKQEYKLSNLVKKFNCNILNSNEFLDISSNLYFNINTPAFYKQALSILPIQEELNVDDLLMLLHHPHVQIVDVRNEDELPKLEIIPHHKIPMSQLETKLSALDHTQPTIFICHAGIRSLEALNLAHEMFDFQNAFHLKGGLIKHWHLFTGIKV